MREVQILSPEQLDKLYGDAENQELQEIVQELKNLHGKLEESKGQKVLNLMNDLNRSRIMLDRNKEELIQSIRSFEDDFTAFDSGEEQVRDALTEVTRKLHNYLAMALSLREHAYRVVNKLDDGLKSDYEEKLEKTGLAKEGTFIINLRNYVQHRRLPIATGRVQSQATNKILFDREELEAWDNWDPDGRERLNELDEEFEIEDEIEHYHQISSEFYDWFSEAIRQQYSDEIEDRDKIIDEIVEVEQSKLYR